MRKIRFRTFMPLVVAATMASNLAGASVNLPIGSPPVIVPGTTAAAEADLAGVVLHDRLIPFRITNAWGALLFEGRLQNRVVKSSRGGVLHFYYAIRNTRPGLNGIVRALSTKSFAATPQIRVDWRPDGLGAVNPVKALRSAGAGELVQFIFNPAVNPLVGGAESKFMFVKTRALNFVGGGRTWIQLTSGESATLNTVMPTP